MSKQLETIAKVFSPVLDHASVAKLDDPFIPARGAVREATALLEETSLKLKALGMDKDAAEIARTVSQLTSYRKAIETTEARGFCWFGWGHRWTKWIRRGVAAVKKDADYGDYDSNRQQVIIMVRECTKCHHIQHKNYPVPTLL